MLNLKLIIFVFGCCLTISSARRNAKIVGGSFAQDHQFPHQISLQYNGHLHVCGGSILNPDWIITAAHCVTWSDKSLVKAEDLSIRAGSNTLGVDGVVVNVAKVIVHEKYGLNLNDLALLKLETPLTLSDTVKSIEIRSEEVPNNSEIIVYGWGKTTHKGVRSETLKMNTLTALSQKECNKRFGFDFDQIICFVSPVGQGVCQGDSGGGAIYDGKLIGVASFVKETCGGKYPDLYVRLSTYLDWIKENMV